MAAQYSEPLGGADADDPDGDAGALPPVLSLVTGQCSYHDGNARELLAQWVDHPQRLWDAVDETLATGVELVVHVGPEPNLVPATFQRVAENVRQMLSERTLSGISLRAVSRLRGVPGCRSCCRTAARCCERRLCSK